MSYTAPSGSAIGFQYPTHAPYWVPFGDSVNFNDRHHRVYGTFGELVFGSGYTVPAADSANLSFLNVDSPPRFAANTSTTVSFFGKVDVASSFASATSTVVQFQHWYRDFIITANSTASFVTWQRAVAINTSTTTLFRHGFRTVINTSSATTMYGIAALQASTNIPGSTTVTAAWTSTNKTDFSSAGHTYASFTKTDTQPRRAVVLGGSGFIPKQQSSAGSAATFSAGTVFHPRYAESFVPGQALVVRLDDTHFVHRDKTTVFTGAEA